MIELVAGDALVAHALLFLATVAAGAINAAAGGGGLLTFPLLLAVLPPVAADATSALALLPGYATSTWACRAELAPLRRWLWFLLPPAVLGGLAGALLLTHLGARAFVPLIPWLLIAATALIFLRPYLVPGSGPQPVQEGDGTNPPSVPGLWPIPVALMFAVGVYGGFFGAGIGLLVLGILGIMGLGDIHRSVALKNALSGALRTVAVTVFVVQGRVEWGYGLVMAAGAMAGGYLGARLLRRTHPTALRAVVVVIGLGVSAYFFWRLYGQTLEHLGGD